MANETTVLRGIASGGTGGEITAIDSIDGKLVRFRPFQIDTSYTHEELEQAIWEFEVDGVKCRPGYKSLPNYIALAYKNRVYSKNRVKYPLKRVDWEPGGDPAKINAQNRGKSKFKRISWDEAIDIIQSELERVIEKYGPTTVLCVGEDGHRESKDLQSGGGMHANLMSKLGGYTRETRTPDSVEGWYWGGKHVWGSGANMGLGLIAPPQNGFCGWNVTKDVSENAELISFCAGDWELTQNYASQFYSRYIRLWEQIGKEIIIVDPFCNYTAVCHEDIKWIPVLPNTDSALDFAIMYVWITEDTYDHDFVETHTIGFDKVKAYILGDEDGIPKTPAWAAERCGVPAWTIKAYARRCASKVTTYAHYSSGAVKGPYSHEAGRTEPYKLGMQGLGKPGVQQLYMNNADMTKSMASNTTTRPFVMLNQCRQFYPTAQSIPRTLVASAIQDGKLTWWGSPSIVYVKTEEQFQEFNYPAPAEQGGTKVHVLWSEKPCNMNCWNGGFNFQDAIRTPEVEMFITNHQWLENDSLFADLILPVTTCVEEDDTVGSSAQVGLKHAGIQDKACDVVGESKSDWEIALAVAERFGVRDQIDLGMSIDEWRQYGFEQSKLPEEIGWDEFKEKSYYFPKLDPNWRDVPPGMRGFYEDPENWPLDTPSGKIEFYSQALADNFPDDKERQPIAKWVVGGPKEEGWTHDESLWGERCKQFPLLVIACPAKWRVHVQGDDIKWFREIETMKTKGKDGYLYEPLWIHPDDAAARGIENGDICKLYNDRGTILFAARVSERVIPGAVLVHKGSRVDPIAPHLDRGGAINLISPTECVSKHCKGFAVTGYLVEAAKVEDAEMAQWKTDYPEAFAREYDPAVGLTYTSWVVE